MATQASLAPFNTFTCRKILYSTMIYTQPSLSTVLFCDFSLATRRYQYTKFNNRLKSRLTRLRVRQKFIPWAREKFLFTCRYLQTVSVNRSEGTDQSPTGLTVHSGPFVPLRYKGGEAGIVTYSSMQQATWLRVLRWAGNALSFPLKIMGNAVSLSDPFSVTNYNRITRAVLHNNIEAATEKHIVLY
jgi:hypothetical protein